MEGSSGGMCVQHSLDSGTSSDVLGDITSHGGIPPIDLKGPERHSLAKAPTQIVHKHGISERTGSGGFS